MVDRLRRLLNRPLADIERRRLFLVAVVVIVAAAAGFSLLDDHGSPVGDSGAGVTSSGTSSLRSAPFDDPAGVVALEAPSEEGRLSASQEASRVDVTRAKRAARRFLAGYLAYSYGRADAGQIRTAAPGLRRRLAAEQPRVPARVRRRRPRLLLVQADGVGRLRGRLLALVGNGSRRYTVGLELARTRIGWAVTDVGP
jgi:hypothetical protein